MEKIVLFFYNRKISKVISNQTCPLCAIEKNKKRLGEYSKKNGSPRKLNTKIFKEKVDTSSIVSVKEINPNITKQDIVELLSNVNL